MNHYQITRRDYFIAAALKRLIEPACRPTDFGQVAEDAILQADILLAHLGVEPPKPPKPQPFPKDGCAWPSEDAIKAARRPATEDRPGYFLLLMNRKSTSGDYDDAIKWANDNGCSLPNREEAAILHGHFASHFSPGWHWLEDDNTVGGIECYHRLAMDFMYGTVGTLHRSCQQVMTKYVKRIPID